MKNTIKTQTKVPIIQTSFSFCLLTALLIIFLILKAEILMAGEGKVHGLGFIVEQGHLKFNDILEKEDFENFELSSESEDITSYGLQYSFLNYVNGKNSFSLEYKAFISSTFKKSLQTDFFAKKVGFYNEAYRMDSLQLSLTFFAYAAGIEHRQVSLWTRDGQEKLFKDNLFFVQFDFPFYLFWMSGFSPIWAYRITFGNQEGINRKFGIAYLWEFYIP